MRECRADLAKALSSGAGADALVLGERHLLQLAVGALDLCGDGYNLIVKVASLLGLLGSLEALRRVNIHLLSSNVEVSGDVLAGPAHGLSSIFGLLGPLDNGLVELTSSAAARGHGLGTDSDTHRDGIVGDLVCNVGDGLEAGGAEAVDDAGGDSVGEASSQGCSSDLVGRLSIAGLRVYAVSQPKSTNCCRKTYVAEADVLNDGRVDTAVLADLLEQGHDHVLQAGVLEATLSRLAQRRAGGIGDDDVIGVLGLAASRHVLSVY